ncbi:MAG: hypothetical protein II942_02570 [Alphaproteobacteria bacterium]|nr:hypothetical protein [Alphaproteobacteria bacterium]
MPKIEMGSMMIVFILSGLLVGVLIGWMITIKTRRRLKHTVRFLQTLMSHVPVGVFYQDLENRTTFASNSLCLFFNQKESIKWPQILSFFDAATKTTLDEAYQTLTKKGTGFTLFVPTSNKSFHFLITGTAIQTPTRKGVLITFADVSEPAQKLHLANLMEQHKNILAGAMESLPFPLFIRDSKGMTFFANSAVNQEKADTLNELSWLSLPFQSENNFYTLTYGQETKTEEELNLILENMVTAQRRLCEQLPCAVCLFNAAGQLLACSNAFAQLWKLDMKWVQSGPSYEDYWDVVQDNGLLSRVSDFADYKRQQRESFARLSTPSEIFLYLPDGGIIRRVMIPYVQGSVILLDEDQTKAKK